MPDPTPSFEDANVAAWLVRRSREGRAALLDELVAVLSTVVPGVKIERTLFRRRVTAVRFPVGGSVYVLKRSARESYEASRQQEVRGVVVRTIPMELDAFVDELGVALDVELQRTEKGREALQAWLNPKP